MNRRTLLRSIAVAPAASAALVAQEPVRLPPAAKPAPSETPNTPTVSADSLAQTIGHAFQPEQLSALARLGELIAPASADTPGADDANAAGFLDFLIGKFTAPVLELYRSGLDALNEESRKHYRKAFFEITDSQAAPLLAPLRRPWTYEAPDALLPRFLLVAKNDILRATFTSREYISVVARRRRSAGGAGQYWFPVD